MSSPQPSPADRSAGPERVRPELWPQSGLPVREMVMPTGEIVLVDGDYDGEWLSGYSWYVNKKTGFVMARSKKDRRPVYLARLVLGLTNTAEYATYRNGNKLDCRSINLVAISSAQNAAKRPIGTGGGSRVKGSAVTGYVGVHKAYQLVNGSTRYVAKIGSARAQQYLGVFSTPEEAARAYDRAAVARWGSYAQLNFPREYMDGDTMVP